MNELLDKKFYADDLGEEVTIRDYFRTLLTTLWVDEETFSGKRPLGSSGWKYAIGAFLIKHNHIKGSLDEYGDVRTMDMRELDEFVCTNIISKIFK